MSQTKFIDGVIINNNFIPPSMTTTERDLLTPSEGMTIYNETDGEYSSYNGTWWTNSPITKDFTTADSQATIQTWFDTLSGKTFKYDITVNFAAGVYGAGSLVPEDIRLTNGAKIKIVGSDTESFLGYGFFHNQVTDASVTATLTTLSLAGAVLTVNTGSNYDFSSMTGKVDLFGWTGAAWAEETMTIASTTADTITFTGAPSTITTMDVNGAGFYYVSDTNMAALAITNKCPDAVMYLSKIATKFNNGSATEKAGEIQLEQCNISPIYSSQNPQIYSGKVTIEKCTARRTFSFFAGTSFYANLLSQKDSTANAITCVNIEKGVLLNYKAIQAGKISASRMSNIYVEDAEIFVFGTSILNYFASGSKGYLDNIKFENINAQGTTIAYYADTGSFLSIHTMSIKNVDTGLRAGNLGTIYEESVTFDTVNTNYTPTQGNVGNNLGRIA